MHRGELAVLPPDRTGRLGGRDRHLAGLSQREPIDIYAQRVTRAALRCGPRTACASAAASDQSLSRSSRTAPEARSSRGRTSAAGTTTTSTPSGWTRAARCSGPRTGWPYARGGLPASPQITPAESGGAIVTWQDHRSGNYDIYAQRVNASGAVQWTTDGVALCTATSDRIPRSRRMARGRDRHLAGLSQRRMGPLRPARERERRGAVDDRRGAPVHCGGHPGGSPDRPGRRGGRDRHVVGRSQREYDIYAQRVGASGVVQWTTDGVPLCTAAGHRRLPRSPRMGRAGRSSPGRTLAAGRLRHLRPAGERERRGAVDGGRRAPVRAAGPQYTPRSSRTARGGRSSPGRTIAAGTTTSTPSG